MIIRPRRNRHSDSIRALVRENAVTTDDLIYPLFVEDGKGVKDEIHSLPGNYRWSIDTILDEIGQCMGLGVHAFILFPKVSDKLKDSSGSYGISPSNFYLEVARKIKSTYPECTLISDIALDPYNSDGHDGIVKNGVVQNDETIERLCNMAVLQAQAGFDILGPSDMMDGRIRAIREELDKAGKISTGIMSYTAKYASAFYGPFRDALDSAPVQDANIPKDKKTYQMDPANKKEALIEAALDTREGADFLMVKPALHYLDIIHLLREKFELPIAAYHVSGECAQLIAASKMNWLDFETAMPEALLSIKRAGADVILTYFAKEYAKLINS